MIFARRVYLAASLLQSAAVVNGRKALELIRNGASMKEGCAEHRCALVYQPSSFYDYGFVYQGGPSYFATDHKYGEFFTHGDFLEMGWQTLLDKDSLCQVCLAPPTGNIDPLKIVDYRDKPIFLDYQYVVDDLNCQGFQDDYFGVDELADLGYIYCLEEWDRAGRPGDYPDGLNNYCGNNPFVSDQLQLDGTFDCQKSLLVGSNVDGDDGYLFNYRPGVPMTASDQCSTFQAMPEYKIIDRRFWSEVANDISTTKYESDFYYCANNFQDYLDPCCLESLAPSVKPTLPPTNIFGNENSLAPTTASDDNPCFSESATVEVQGKGKVTMKSLLVGDVVRTPSGYEKVYTIDHRSEEKPTDFIQIHTEIEEPLEVTGTHLIFKVGKNDPVEARSIVVGDELQGYFNGEMKSVVVEKITSISKNGLYNPITTSGTIVVDGLVTSTYTAVNLSDGSNYLTIGGYKVLSMHDFMHMAMIPFKTICMTLSDSSFCSVSGGNEHNSYNQIGLSVMAYGKSQNIYVQNYIIVSLITLFVIVNILSTPAVLVSLILFKTMKKGTKIE